MQLRPFLGIALSLAAGATTGAAFGIYQVERTVERMLSQYGWVCGTGLYLPVFIWAIVFAGLSMALYLAFRDRRIGNEPS